MNIVVSSHIELLSYYGKQYIWILSSTFLVHKLNRFREAGA